ncbi:MAG: rhodanese-related sulfurtransferase [Rickettsiales bacterium]
MTFVVATFYHFFDFADYASKREPLLDLFAKHNIKGSLLIADEGFNGTISGTREDIDVALAYLKDEIAHGEFEHKESFHNVQPFKRCKVRLKKETISLREHCPPELRGEYVEPKDWNALIADPDTIVLDTRNTYETYLGTFERAIDPQIRNFRDLPEYIRSELSDKKDKKIATFCTGGIRCEKLTSWMKDQGFEKVYHLKGGILKYFEDVPTKDSMWNGECYVFDERIAVDQELNPSTDATSCQPCGHTLTAKDRADERYQENVSCPYCFDMNWEDRFSR